MLRGGRHFLNVPFSKFSLKEKGWCSVYFSAFVCLNVMTLILFSSLSLLFFSEAQAQPIGKPLMSSKKQLT